MIAAGVDAFFLDKSEELACPGGIEMDDMMRDIFKAMWSSRHHDLENDENTKSPFSS